MKKNKEVVAKKSNTKTANKSSSETTLVKLENFLLKNETIIFFSILLVSLIFSVLLFDIKMSEGNDDSDYIEEALQSLNHTIVVGYSGEQIPHICVWGRRWIVIRCVYDGYTWLERLPRNPDPTYEIPDFGGG